MSVPSIEETHKPAAAGTVFVSLSGLPLLIELQWPFHNASSGADFFVLHANVKLADGSGLHALAAVNLSLTVKEVLPSLDPQHTEGPVINALRKEVDRKQLEFLKSPKLVPVHFSSRYYSFKTNAWAFPKAYWASQSQNKAVEIADAIDAQYVCSTVDHLQELARKLAAQGLITLNGGLATATDAIAKHAEAFQADMKTQLEELQKKHTFERG